MAVPRIIGVDASTMATPRIIGGQPATANAYPFALALSLRRGFICGASLVSETWALTAAHCVTLSSWEPVSRYVVGARRHDISIASGADGDCAEEIEVAEIQRHPRYDAMTMLNDICLLRLSRPPRCPASYVTLDVSGAASAAGTLARVIGWGDQTASSYDYEAYTVLREVDVPLLVQYSQAYSGSRRPLCEFMSLYSTRRAMPSAPNGCPTAASVTTSTTR